MAPIGLRLTQYEGLASFSRRWLVLSDVEPHGDPALGAQASSPTDDAVEKNIRTALTTAPMAIILWNCEIEFCNIKMVQVLNRAFDILEHLSTEPDRPKGLGRIAGSLGLHPATCANILKTMVRRGFVDQAGPKKGYTLGPTAYRLARKGPYRKELVSAAESPMIALAKKLRETVLIATLRQYERAIPCQVEGDQDLQVRSDITNFSGVYESVTGRLLLAFLPDERLETFILARGLPSKGAWPGVRTKAQISAALRNIHRDGKAVDTSGPEIAAAAYPIWQDQAVVAALGLFLPKFRFKGTNRGKVLAGLKATAEEITRRLSKSSRRKDS